MRKKLSDYGFLRVATCTPTDLEVGDVAGNADKIVRCIEQAIKDNVQVIVFPELCLTGYTCGELFRSEVLHNEIRRALRTISEACGGNILAIVGAPLRTSDCSAMYNCAIAISSSIGQYMVVPKQHLPNYGEFYEKRWFSEYRGGVIDFGVMYVHATTGIVSIRNSPIRIGIEICEDLWVPNSPSIMMARSGANVIVNLSAGNEIIGKADYRRKLVEVTSAKNICGYIYCNAGMYESTQDMVFSGHSMIAENGTILAENTPFDTDNMYLITELDISKISHDRIRQDTFGYRVGEPHEFALTVDSIAVGSTAVPYADGLHRNVNPMPFVPSSEYDLDNRCRAILNMQSWGLAKRIKACKCKKVVIGISGGLDSTLALMVAVYAMNNLGRPVTDIVGITMPGMGTTNRTKNNAIELMKALGITYETIPIKNAVVEHLNNLGHELDVHDVTYENAQARERTQILFDYANMHNGIVIGTGDLSELALGWCTYNGDQMSSYGVNASIPKTLVRFLVQHCADVEQNEEACKLLYDIIETPISPELLPCDKDGNIVQKTEDTVGSYMLNDFFMYNMLRCGYGPRKLMYMALEAARQHSIGDWTFDTVKETLQKFIKRFFAMQFKRSCMPDAPKVGSVTLSPRGDWRMPSDASAEAWLRELDCVTNNENA